MSSGHDLSIHTHQCRPLFCNTIYYSVYRGATHWRKDMKGIEMRGIEPYASFKFKTKMTKIIHIIYIGIFLEACPYSLQRGYAGIHILSIRIIQKSEEINQCKPPWHIDASIETPELSSTTSIARVGSLRGGGGIVQAIIKHQRHAPPRYHRLCHPDIRRFLPLSFH